MLKYYYKNKYKQIIEPDPADITYDCHDEQFEDKLSRSSATGEYVGIDVTNETEYPVIAYFDSANRIIRLAREIKTCHRLKLITSNDCGISLTPRQN